MARDNLENGVSVVADSVNCTEITRSAWRRVALDLNVKYREIEILCSDENEHRRRLETRQANNPQERRLTWEDVRFREYEKWENALVFDTSGESVEDSIRRFQGEVLPKEDTL